MAAQRTPGKRGIADMWYRPDGTPTKLALPGSSPRNPKGKQSRWRAWYIDPQGKEKTKRFATKPPADAWLNAQTAAMVAGTHIDAKHRKTTLDGFYKEWSQDQVWVHGTRRASDLAVNSATFKDIPFADLELAHVQAWVKTMQDKPLEPSTIATRVNYVRIVIRAAVRARKLSHDVAHGVKLPRQRKASAAMSIPTPREVDGLLAGTEDPYVACVALCAFAGLRPGEAAAPQIRDIDFTKREINVQRQLQPGKGGLEIRAPKYESERIVYAPDGLLKLLRAHIDTYLPDAKPDAWLFPGNTDKLPAHFHVMRRWWNEAKKAADADYRLHDLRHYYASGLIAAGCDVVTVQKALGHSSASVTLNTYAHLWPNAADRTRTAAADIFDQANGSAYVVRTKAK
ncbi:tyrosine-type recombinase/integrase [Mycobacteroides abscessus]|uniref:tyrosine-type recombinase/integrase n=1 Tax=Mycobacteroides abscessus TaxID=36809 RepID=UPI001A98A566|nr:site-specific integrase [Mycobacteroides abscessus]